jgi:UDP-N-acetylglucosamine 1-carboxyvinyltransferase
MSKYIIKGGKPLHGTVRLGGAKNASFKLMIAATLADSPSRLLNLAKIGDVQVTGEILTQLGMEFKNCGERSLQIIPHNFNSSTIPQINGKKNRASTLLAAVLLAQTGEAIIPQPGGCVLGIRPIDRHLDAFKSLGVEIEETKDNIHLKAKKLKASKFRFPKKTHTGTEALLLAAVKAEGETIIENAGLEPEIDDLIKFLNKMGARIKRQDDSILISGVKKLKGTNHRVMSDRNEAVSYAIAALATKGDIIVEDAQAKYLQSFLDALKKAGAKYEVSNYGIRFFYHKKLLATKIKTAPEPGFMTDWQPLWALLMTQADGESEIVEAVHNNRFQYVDHLNKIGANISLYNPQVENPEIFYEFDNGNNDNIFHACKISGPTSLKALDTDVPDLRAGATLAIAALIAEGTTELSNIYHIERGYEDLDKRLNQLGADIKKIS